MVYDPFRRVFESQFAQICWQIDFKSQLASGIRTIILLVVLCKVIIKFKRTHVGPSPLSRGCLSPRTRDPRMCACALTTRVTMFTTHITLLTTRVTLCTTHITLYTTRVTAEEGVRCALRSVVCAHCSVRSARFCVSIWRMRLIRRRGCRPPRNILPLMFHHDSYHMTCEGLYNQRYE